MKRMFTPILAAVLVAGCNAGHYAGKATFGTSLPNSSTVAGTTLGGSTLAGTTVDGTSKVGSTLAVRRTLDFEVRANSSLADGNGKIINTDPAGIVAAGGGNVISAGGGSIVASGGGNIVAAGGGNLSAIASGNFAPKFDLLATAQSKYTLVSKAVVHVESVDGVRLGTSYITTTDDGKITLSNLPDTPLLIVAQWKENGQVYRTSSLISTGVPVMLLQIDPITHFVQARIRALLATSGKVDALAGAQLAAVWAAFNDANISPSDDILKDDASLDDLNAFYTAKVGQLPTDKQCLVKQYMATLGAPQPSSSLCPTTTTTVAAGATAAAKP